MRPVVCVRPVGEFGYEWVNAPFAKISDGVPIVLEPTLAEDEWPRS